MTRQQIINMNHFFTLYYLIYFVPILRVKFSPLKVFSMVHHDIVPPVQVLNAKHHGRPFQPVAPFSLALSDGRLSDLVRRVPHSRFDRSGAGVLQGSRQAVCDMRGVLSTTSAAAMMRRK